MAELSPILDLLGSTSSGGPWGHICGPVPNFMTDSGSWCHAISFLVRHSPVAKKLRELQGFQISPVWPEHQSVVLILPTRGATLHFKKISSRVITREVRVITREVRVITCEVRALGLGPHALSMWGPKPDVRSECEVLVKTLAVWPHGWYRSPETWRGDSLSFSWSARKNSALVIKRCGHTGPDLTLITARFW